MADTHRLVVVTLDKPKGVTDAELAKYVSEAIGCWCKTYDPDCDLFDLDQETVTARVVAIKPKKGK